MSFSQKTFMALSLAAASVVASHAQTLDIMKDGAPIATYNSALVQDFVFNPQSADAEVLARYKVAQINITTAGGAEITSKEDYIDCEVAVDSEFDEWDYSGSAQIRGRGNSSWLWYDKKPYRIKLKKKASILGMPEGKSWVLLANYRDPTDLMNSYVFVLGQMMGLRYTNDVRYAEVTLNGENLGLYQVTEQVQQGKGRVNINEKEGYLIGLDLDDGPDLSPDATDNFWSKVYELPVVVKNPDDPDAAMVKQVRNDLGQLENAIQRRDYEQIKQLLDVRSMIDYLIIQEFVYNVELDAPRSMYMYKDIDGDCWHMGPLWDFDAGYDFNWGNMYTGHDYFDNYRELVLGTKPAWHEGTYYWVSGFFTDLFFIDEFVADYKARWAVVKSLTEAAWVETLRYVDDSVWAAEDELWPIGKSYSAEIERMGKWLRNRANYMDGVIKGY